MCTVFYSRALSLLSKNRDKEDATEEEIVRTPDLLAVRTRGAAYYSLAINRHGCAFVSTAVNDPGWTQAVERGDKALAKRLAEEDVRGLVSPTVMVSEMADRVRDISEWIDALTQGAGRWRGYHVVMAQADGGFVAECHRDQVIVRPLEPRDAVVNHFRSIAHGPRQASDYPNSFQRLDYARSQLPTQCDFEALAEAACPQDPVRAKAIWRSGAFSTVSSSIIDIAAKALHYAVGPGQAFIRHTLPR